MRVIGPTVRKVNKEHVTVRRMPVTANNGLRDVEVIARQLGADTMTSHPSQEHERLAATRLFVTCIGQFKRGKVDAVERAGQAACPARWCNPGRPFDILLNDVDCSRPAVGSR